MIGRVALEILCVEPIYPQYSGVLSTCLTLRYWFFEVLGSESVNIKTNVVGTQKTLPYKRPKTYLEIDNHSFTCLGHELMKSVVESLIECFLGHELLRALLLPGNFVVYVFLKV